MNYAILETWVVDRVEELVQFGIPRVAASALMQEVERAAIVAEAKSRSNEQFLIDFKRDGAAALGKRYGKSRQAMWQKRRKLLSKENTLGSVAVTVD